jgi:ABC-type branched-subunit amino acid transport system ATPase component
MPEMTALTGDVVLSLRELSVDYGAVRAVDSVSLDLREGTCRAIIGANGAGKTSLLRGLSGLERVSAGVIELDGRQLQARTGAARARAGLGHVMEHRHLFPNLSVRENISLGTIAAAGRAHAGDIDRILQLFPDVTPLLDRPAASLSGGQQQFVAICRSLAGKPRVVMMDEPTVGLAPRLIDGVIDAIRSIVELGTAVLLVEQRLQVVQAVATEVDLLAHGRVLATTTGDDPELEQKARDTYLS